MFGFTDLEDRFLGPDGRSALQSALGSVHAIKAEVQAGIAAGLTKDDYALAERILAAARAAEQILVNAAKLKGA